MTDRRHCPAFARSMMFYRTNLMRLSGIRLMNWSLLSGSRVFVILEAIVVTLEHSRSLHMFAAK